MEDAWADDGFDRFVQLEFAHGGILISDIGNVLGDVDSVYQLLSEQPSTGDTSQLSTMSRVVRWATTGGSVNAGIGGCKRWPETDEVRLPARFGVLDLAGNFSGWQDMVLEIPSSSEAQELVADTSSANASNASFEPLEPGTSSACSWVVPRRAGSPLTWLTLGIAGAVALRRRQSFAASRLSLE